MLNYNFESSIFLSKTEAELTNWSDLGAKVFVRVGSWNDSNQMTPQKFSELLKPDSMTKFSKALIDYFAKNPQFTGLLISWYYPQCLYVSFTTLN